MTTIRYTFAETAAHVRAYERGPAPLSEDMQNNLMRVLVVNIASIPFLLLVPHVLTSLGYSSFYGPAGGILFWLATALNVVSYLLLALSVFSLLGVGYIWFKSEGMTAPVPIDLHRLGEMTGYHAGIVTLIAGSTTTVFVVVSVIALVLWVVFIILAFIFGIFFAWLLIGILLG